jgi:peptidoglycan hydrolase-like protein with peptidoglycan-binding domain
MNIYYSGLVQIGDRGTRSSLASSEWEWDGTKPVIKFEDISKNASGYVQPTDTNWSAVTDDNKIIGLNAKGPLVKQVQHALIKVGYSGTTSGSVTTDVVGCKDDVEKCDGIYGPTTKEMVKQFQKDNGLSVDGIVGQQTYFAFDEL